MSAAKLNCLITGVGGQGTVLLSRLVGGAALRNGLNVRGSETIGMAQRGGSVVSHIRMSDAAIHSPQIPPGCADIVIAFEPAEALRVLPFLSPGGRLLALNRSVPGVLAALQTGGGCKPEDTIAALRKICGGRLTLIDGEPFIAAAGVRCINTGLFGAALALGVFPFGIEEAEALIGERLAPAFVEMNVKALRAGMAFAG